MTEQALEYSAGLQQRITHFEEGVFDPLSGVVDPEGVHHEFSAGLHGQKYDMDKIEEGSDLYREWIEVQAEFITETFGLEALQSAVLVGVANGTNRVVRDLSFAFEFHVPYLRTIKSNAMLPHVSPAAGMRLQEINPELAIVVEDVITLGTNSTSVVASVYDNAGPNLKRIEVVGAIQRNEYPKRLEVMRVPYHAMVKRFAANLTTKECQTNPDGFCAQGWKLIPRPKD